MTLSRGHLFFAALFAVQISQEFAKASRGDTFLGHHAHIAAYVAALCGCAILYLVDFSTRGLKARRHRL
ncbi:hypothetical protein [Asaia astilbis]|uniref:hypothetical protein n=1 Tax=Asaia astilbis TaxID=610244 RepID=UPI00046EEE43|nr:hypothetical protein [Asaia astilbis]